MEFGGEHTDEKLKILMLYLDFFTQVLKARPSPNNPFKLAYVDPFCGNGHSQTAGDPRVRDGSALIALDIDDRPFDDFYFNDKTTDKRHNPAKNRRNASPRIGLSITTANRRNRSYRSYVPCSKSR